MLALHSSTLADVKGTVDFQLVDGNGGIIVGEVWAEGSSKPLPKLALQSSECSP